MTAVSCIGRRRGVVEEGRDGGRAPALPGSRSRRRARPTANPSTEQQHRQAEPDRGPDQGDAASTGDQHAGGQEDQRRPRQPTTDRDDGPIAGLDRRDLVRHGDRNGALHRRDPGRDRQAAGEQSGFDVLDDRVRAGRRSSRRSGRRSRLRDRCAGWRGAGCGSTRRARSQLWAKASELTNSVTPLRTTVCRPWAAGSFKASSAALAAGRVPRALIPSKTSEVSCSMSMFLVDRRRRLIDDECLHLGVVGQGRVRRDEVVGVGEGGLRPAADHGQRRHQAAEHDQHRRPAPSTPAPRERRPEAAASWAADGCPCTWARSALFSASSRG